MKILTVLNEKGGVGKTTLAVTISAGLAARGHAVLLIDADAQGHATRALGLAKYPGLYDLLVRDARLPDVIKPIPAAKYNGSDDTLAVLGSNVETRNIANSISDAYALADRLAALDALFDFTIIDTAPTPSLLHGSVYLATDAILYPTFCEFWSFDGLAESWLHRRQFEHARRVAVAGIVPMRVRTHTLEHSENLAELRTQYGDLVWDAVPERIVWAEAATFQVPVFVHDPTSDAARHAWALVDRAEAWADGE